MKAKKAYTLIVYLLAINYTFSQTFINEDIIFENYAYKIKLIDEFMKRFNFEALVVLPEQDSMYQVKNRILLFNQDTYLNNQELADSMIEKSLQDSVFLHFSDTTWTATAICEITYKGKKDSITLLLKPENIKDDVYKWAIIDAWGEQVELKPKTQNDYIRLYASDNETRFISLTSATEDNKKNIVLFSKNKYEVDRLTAFNTLVYNDILKIKYVKQLTYQFVTINGFEFTVSYFNRDSKNSGWLISEIHHTKQ
ncbi:MAG: hypothetical protein IJ756_06475 [Paludibacteraceae bacterium]|nr:hypothetical protein [Paludibacteraceae bacterium]